MNLQHVLLLFRVARIAMGSLAVAALVALMSLTVLAPANAHDVVEKVEPAEGSTAASVPAAVKLTFNNTPIGLGAEVLVEDANGTNQSIGPVIIEDNVAAQAVKAEAPAGRYTVVWRIVSSDSHPIEGTFTFTAGKSNGPSESATASAATAPAATAPAREPAPGHLEFAGCTSAARRSRGRRFGDGTVQSRGTCTMKSGMPENGPGNDKRHERPGVLAAHVIAWRVRSFRC